MACSHPSGRGPINNGGEKKNHGWFYLVHLKIKKSGRGANLKRKHIKQLIKVELSMCSEKKGKPQYLILLHQEEIIQ